MPDAPRPQGVGPDSRFGNGLVIRVRDRQSASAAGPPINRQRSADSRTGGHVLNEFQYT
ncbi:hypothetical protein RSAG8_05259, partial [Rhizoctonia solani AG-8 WAC10335]